MKKLTLISISILLAACSLKNAVQEKESTQTSSVDYFPEKANVQYAKNFTVMYHANYKVVRTSATLGEWVSDSNELEDIEDVMVLVQRGTPIPDLGDEFKGATYITIPASDKIANNSPIIEIWLEMLELENKQVAIGGTKTYDDSLRNLVSSRKLGEVGYSWASPPDMEVLMARSPQIFLMALSRVGFNQYLSKLREIGIATAPVFDWAERDYLARAEWIKYISLFFNKEKEANQVFNQIEQRVGVLKDTVAHQKMSPVCVWGHFVDSGFWLANVNNSEAKLLKDAGVINPVEDFSKPFNPVGEAFTNEEWLHVASKSEHWILSTGTSHVQLPSISYLEEFESWRENNLYHHYLRSKPEQNAFDWYNLSTVRPDLVLGDLIALFYPQSMPEHQFTFFGHYRKDESL